MAEDKKKIKLPYEPPQILDLFSSPAYAQTVACAPGSGVASFCNRHPGTAMHLRRGPGGKTKAAARRHWNVRPEVRLQGQMSVGKCAHRTMPVGSRRYGGVPGGAAGARCRKGGAPATSSADDGEY